MKKHIFRTRISNINIIRIVVYIFLITIAISVILPFIIIVNGSFKTEIEMAYNPVGLTREFTMSNYVKAIFETGIPRKFLNTILLTVSVLFLTLSLGSLSAFAIAKLKIKINNFLYLLFISGLLIPAFVSVTPLMFLVIKLNLLGNLFIVILIYVGTLQPFTVFILTSFFREIPAEMLESARIDGCNNFLTFFIIILPLSKGALGSVSIMIILRVWNDFLFPLVFLQGTNWKTLTQGIYLFQSEFYSNWGGIFAFVIIQIFPIMVIYLLLQRLFISGIMAGSIKG